MNRELFLVNTSRFVRQEEASRSRQEASYSITVVMPAYNEEICIGSIVLMTRDYAERVIVVDDGSSDRTSSIARQAGAEVIVHETNKGKNTALKTGLRFAKGTDIIVTMDSDGRHDPADIPKLTAPIIADEADIINGIRCLNGNGKKTPLYRHFIPPFLSKTVNINSGPKITGPKITYSKEDFCAFSKHTRDMFHLNNKNMEIENEVLIDTGKTGLRIKEVEIGNKM